MSQRTTIPLKIKALVFVLAVVVLAVGVVVWLDVRRSADALRRMEEDTARGLASSIGAACELSLAVGDRLELNRLARRYMDIDDDLSFVAVLDSDGQVLANEVRDQDAWGRYLIGGSSEDVFILGEAEVDALESSGFTVDYGSEFSGDAEAEAGSVGRVVVGVSLASMLAAQAEQRLASIASMSFAVLVSVIAVVPIVGGWTRRLEALVGASDCISSGDFTHGIRDTHKDEVGVLAQSFERMRRAIGERDRAEKQHREELDKARREAESANAAKSQFLAHMSHEIRTPLNGVVGMLDLLRGTRMGSDQSRFVDIAQSSASALLSVINDILDFSKIESGQLSLESIDFDVHDVIESVVEMLAPKGQQNGLEIAHRIAGDVPQYVRGDPYRFRQILLNLLSNAIKFTDEGEVIVSAVQEGARDGRRYMRVSVADTGMGVPARVRDRLFKSFSQVDGSTTRKFGGTGLGLAISKSLVELMHGEIGISEDRRVGSEFWYTVGFEEAQSAPAPRERRELSPGRVLIVDDNQTNREILVEALKSWGMRPDEAPDAPSALRSIRSAVSEQDAYKIALIDMQMPGMDGLQLADAIQSDPEIEPMRVIMISSISGTADAQDLANHGIESYLSKPLRLSCLYNALTTVDVAACQHGGAAEKSAVSRDGDVSGLRVLVAEDNPVNQIVVGELLAAHGVEAEIVENGRLAVDAWRRGEYDAVLMDCEMPVLDGFQATAEIRQEELADSSLGRTPIIALTAKAIQGDRELCLERGMDDYVSKPISPELVFEALLRHAPERRASQQVAPAAPGAPVVPAAPIAAASDVLKVDDALARCGGNEVILSKVLGEYTRNARESLDRLGGLVEQADNAEVALVAHSVKGASANVGAERAAQIAAELERLGKQDSGDGLERALELLRVELGRVFEAAERAKSDIETRRSETA